MFLGFDSVNSLSFVKQQAILTWQFFFFVILDSFVTMKSKSQQYFNFQCQIGNKTSRSLIRSVIILVMKKSDSRCVVVRFCYHSYDYRPN